LHKNLQSRCEHKAWGVNPRDLSPVELPAHEMGASPVAQIWRVSAATCRSRSLAHIDLVRLILGLHPRLYASACSAGFKQRFVQGLSVKRFGALFSY